MKTMTRYTVLDLIRELKTNALHAGGYPPPCEAELWEQRDKSKAFRGYGYNRNVRQINALYDLLSEVEKHILHAKKQTDWGAEDA